MNIQAAPQGFSLKLDEEKEIAKAPSEKKARASAAEKPDKTRELTEAEQMARYEEDLKENDWGHQPC